MAPVMLIVGKHRRDQTEDKEAIQIFSYNTSGSYIFHAVQKHSGKQTEWFPLITLITDHI